MKNRGFTLIELLVVIAIIGVIASIGIVNMNKARNKADDAITKSQLAQIRNAANIFFESQEPNSYNGTGGNVQWKCDENNSMFVDDTSGMKYLTEETSYHSGISLRCSSNTNAYQVSASLIENKGGTDPDFYCVNNEGVLKIIEASNHVQAHNNNDTDCAP